MKHSQKPSRKAAFLPPPPGSTQWLFQYRGSGTSLYVRANHRTWFGARARAALLLADEAHTVCSLTDLELIRCDPFVEREGVTSEGSLPPGAAP
jgi:hypothetical protein